MDEKLMNIFEAHAMCWDAVEENDYYTNIFKSTLAKFTADNGLINSEELIVSFWNEFWFNLPDSSSIHRYPFNLICSICEGIIG